MGDRQQAADGLASAVRLLPRVAWHGLDEQTRERQLAGLSGLAADAAAAAVLADRHEAAIELLEQGRSLLWTQALHLRSDFTALAEAAPELEGRLREIGTKLAATSVPGPGSAMTGAAADAATGRQDGTRWELAREWDDVVAQIRLVPGFHAFLEPVPYQELRAAAVGGPVAIINVSRLACHALVLTPQSAEVSVVDMPDVSFTSAAEQVGRLFTARGLGPGAGPHRPPDARLAATVLQWTWEHVAKPVLDSEAIRTAFEARTGPRRIWWCPTGPAAMLPLHAATANPNPDDDDPFSRDSAMGRAVSSYTPTLAALRRCREAADNLRNHSPAERRQLAIGMPDTPGAPLRGVDHEMAELRRYFPPPSVGCQLVGKNEALRARVLDELPSRPWVHWACHGRQNETDPRQSAFVLGDGPLTVEDLAGLSLSDPEFAYLSACETATGSTRLADEALHLAAATQLLGYPHVIATLWTIDDRSALRVTKRVYKELNASGVPNSSDAAMALHAAVGSLRRRPRVSPLTWAPFIHLGP
jgi:hypothetical protein